MCRSCHRKQHDGKAELISIARIIADPQTEASLGVAKSHKNSDLMYVEFILCHADANENQDEFLTEDLKDSYSTAINKPINWGHTTINIGTIFSSKYIDVNNLSEADKTYYAPIDPLEKDFVMCQAAIWEYKHPYEAKIMRDRHASGSLMFSMENKFGKALCSKCEKVFASAYEYCDHLNNRRKTKDTTRKFQESNFVGAGVVVNPADKLAGTLALAADQDFDWISELANAKTLQDLDIKSDIIPYLLWREGIEMRKIDLPTTVIDTFSALDGVVCADDINRVFPIDSPENITNSAKFLLNETLTFYSNEEKLYVMEKLAKAAKNISLDITEFVKEPNGGNDNMVDKNSPEFKEALAAAVAEEMNKLQGNTDLKAAQEAKADADKIIAELKTKFEEIKIGKEKAEADFKSFQENIEKEKLASARFTTLSEAGFAFKDNADKVKTHIASMSDDEFTAYVSMLEEAVVAKTAMTPEEMKKMMEEKKLAADKLAADKKKAAKADDDPVVASNVAIANKVDEIKPTTSAFDEVLGLCR